MKLFYIAKRNLGRNRRRTILSGLCIAFAVISSSFLIGFMDGFVNDVKKNAINYATGNILVQNQKYEENKIFNPIQFNIDHTPSVIRELEELEGVSRVSPRISMPGQIYPGNETKTQYFATGIGVDFTRESENLGLKEGALVGEIPIAGERQAIIGKKLADEIGVKEGDSFTLWTRTAALGSNAMTFTITGIFYPTLNTVSKQNFFTPLEDAQRLMKMSSLGRNSERVQDLLIFLDKGVDETTMKPVIQESLAQLKSQGVVNFDSTLTSWDEYTVMGYMLTIASLEGYLFSFILLLLGTSVMISSMHMSVNERLREIGVLRAMGMKATEIRTLFFQEGFWLSLNASLIGLILGIFVTWVMSLVGINFGLEEIEAGMSSIIYLVVKPISTLVIALLCIFVGTTTSYLSVAKVTKIKVIDAINEKRR